MPSPADANRNNYKKKQKNKNKKQLHRTPTLSPQILHPKSRNSNFAYLLYVAFLITYPFCISSLVAVWPTDNALVLINEVTLRRARLLLGWVIVYGRVNHLGMLPQTPDQLSLFIPTWAGTMVIFTRQPPQTLKPIPDFLRQSLSRCISVCSLSSNFTVLAILPADRAGRQYFLA